MLLLQIFKNFLLIRQNQYFTTTQSNGVGEGQNSEPGRPETQKQELILTTAGRALEMLTAKNIREEIEQRKLGAADTGLRVKFSNWIKNIVADITGKTIKKAREEAKEQLQHESLRGYHQIQVESARAALQARAKGLLTPQEREMYAIQIELEDETTNQLIKNALKDAIREVLALPQESPQDEEQKQRIIQEVILKISVRFEEKLNSLIKTTHGEMKKALKNIKEQGLSSNLGELLKSFFEQSNIIEALISTTEQQQQEQKQHNEGLDQLDQMIKGLAIRVAIQNRKVEGGKIEERKHWLEKLASKSGHPATAFFLGFTAGALKTGLQFLGWLNWATAGGVGVLVGGARGWVESQQQLKAELRKQALGNLATVNSPDPDQTEPNQNNQQITQNPDEKKRLFARSGNGVGKAASVISRWYAALNTPEVKQKMLSLNDLLINISQIEKIIINGQNLDDVRSNLDLVLIIDAQIRAILDHWKQGNFIMKIDTMEGNVLKIVGIQNPEQLKQLPPDLAYRMILSAIQAKWLELQLQIRSKIEKANFEQNHRAGIEAVKAETKKLQEEINNTRKQDSGRRRAKIAVSGAIGFVAGASGYLAGQEFRKLDWLNLRLGWSPSSRNLNAEFSPGTDPTNAEPLTDVPDNLGQPTPLPTSSQVTGQTPATIGGGYHDSGTQNPFATTRASSGPRSNLLEPNPADGEIGLENWAPSASDESVTSTIDVLNTPNQPEPLSFEEILGNSGFSEIPDLGNQNNAWRDERLEVAKALGRMLQRLQSQDLNNLDENSQRLLELLGQSGSEEEEDRIRRITALAEALTNAKTSEERKVILERALDNPEEFLQRREQWVKKISPDSQNSIYTAFAQQAGIDLPPKLAVNAAAIELNTPENATTIAQAISDAVGGAIDRSGEWPEARRAAAEALNRIFEKNPDLLNLIRDEKNGELDPEKATALIEYLVRGYRQAELNNVAAATNNINLFLSELAANPEATFAEQVKYVRGEIPPYGPISRETQEELLEKMTQGLPAGTPPITPAPGGITPDTPNIRPDILSTELDEELWKLWNLPQNTPPRPPSPQIGSAWQNPTGVPGSDILRGVYYSNVKLDISNLQRIIDQIHTENFTNSTHGVYYFRLPELAQNMGIQELAAQLTSEEVVNTINQMAEDESMVWVIESADGGVQAIKLLRELTEQSNFSKISDRVILAFSQPPILEGNQTLVDPRSVINLQSLLRAGVPPEEPWIGWWLDMPDEPEAVQRNSGLIADMRGSNEHLANIRIIDPSGEITTIGELIDSQLDEFLNKIKVQVDEETLDIISLIDKVNKPESQINFDELRQPLETTISQLENWELSTLLAVLVAEGKLGYDFENSQTDNPIIQLIIDEVNRREMPGWVKLLLGVGVGVVGVGVGVVGVRLWRRLRRRNTPGTRSTPEELRTEGPTEDSGTSGTNAENTTPPALAEPTLESTTEDSGTSGIGAENASATATATVSAERTPAAQPENEATRQEQERVLAAVTWLVEGLRNNSLDTNRLEADRDKIAAANNTGNLFDPKNLLKNAGPIAARVIIAAKGNFDPNVLRQELTAQTGQQLEGLNSIAERVAQYLENIQEESERWDPQAHSENVEAIIRAILYEVITKNWRQPLEPVLDGLLEAKQIKELVDAGQTVDLEAKIKSDADTIRALINKLNNEANNDPNSTDAQTYQSIQECLASIENPGNLSVTPDNSTRILAFWELVSIITDLLENQQGWNPQAHSTNLTAVARALAYMIYDEQITFPERPTSSTATSGTPDAQTSQSQLENQPGQELEQTVQKLIQSSNDNDRYRAIQTLAPRLENKELLKKVLEIVGKMVDEYWKYKAMEVLAPHLTTEESLREALEIVEGMKNDGWKLRAIKTLVSHLTTEESLKQTLGIVAGMTHEGWKFDAIEALAPQLKDSTTLLGRALEIVEGMKNDGWKLRAIKTLVSHLTTEESLKQTLGIVARMTHEGWKSDAIEALAPQLKNSKTLLELALEIVEDMKNETWKSKAKAVLNSSLSSSAAATTTGTGTAPVKSAPAEDTEESVGKTPVVQPEQEATRQEQERVLAAITGLVEGLRNNSLDTNRLEADWNKIVTANSKRQLFEQKGIPNIAGPIAARVIIAAKGNFDPNVLQQELTAQTGEELEALRLLAENIAQYLENIQEESERWDPQAHSENVEAIIEAFLYEEIKKIQLKIEAVISGLQEIKIREINISLGNAIAIPEQPLVEPIKNLAKSNQHVGEQVKNFSSEKFNTIQEIFNLSELTMLITENLEKNGQLRPEERINNLKKVAMVLATPSWLQDLKRSLTENEQLAQN